MAIEFSFDNVQNTLYLVNASGIPYALGMDVNGNITAIVSGVSVGIPVPLMSSSGGSITGNLNMISGAGLFISGNSVIVSGASLGVARGSFFKEICFCC